MKQFFRNLLNNITHDTNIPVEDLRNIKESRAAILNLIGIHTVKDLSRSEPNQLWKEISQIPKGKIKFGNLATIKKIIAIAKARIEKQPILIKDCRVFFALRPDDAIFDIEYLNTENVVFSIALGIFPEKEEFTVHTWFADTKEYSKSIVLHFYEMLKKKSIKRLIGYSIGSDLSILDSISSRPDNIEFCDLMQIIDKSIMFPTKTHRLKDIYNSYLYKDTKIEERNLVLNGWTITFNYRKYLQTKDRQIKQTIINYNKDDVYKTFALAQWLENFLKAL